MSLANLLKRKRQPLDVPVGDGVSPITGDIAGNEAVRRRQRLLLASAAGAGLILSSIWIFSSDESVEAAKDDDAAEVAISTKDMVNRNLSQQEWMAFSENRFQSTENRLKSIDGQNRRLEQLTAQVEVLKSENQAMQADGQRVLTAYQSENEQLRRQVNERRTPAPPPGPGALYGADGPQVYQRPPGAADMQKGVVGLSGAPEVKLISFANGPGGTASRVEKGNTLYTDSINYLPPNSFARAKVIVGVDASAGVNSQTDPLPVVLRVTGPARSVLQNGRVLTTRIEGCLVNGAARGDLSAEKIYVKLQKMTCPQPGGRYAVSEVKGFLAFGGKTGVRGRVVSREGSLVTQAFLAGLAGGFGRGFSANANSVFQGTNISTDGKRDKLSTGDILEGGFGEGVAQSGDMVSKYLIERAEQYQPVIEMPTGIDVEIVFLEGVYVRN